MTKKVIDITNRIKTKEPDETIYAFHCNCGNESFYITVNGIICNRCHELFNKERLAEMGDDLK